MIRTAKSSGSNTNHSVQNTKLPNHFHSQAKYPKQLRFNLQQASWDKVFLVPNTPFQSSTSDHMQKTNLNPTHSACSTLPPSAEWFLPVAYVKYGCLRFSTPLTRLRHFWPTDFFLSSFRTEKRSEDCEAGQQLSTRRFVWPSILFERYEAESPICSQSHPERCNIKMELFPSFPWWCRRSEMKKDAETCNCQKKKKKKEDRKNSDRMQCWEESKSQTDQHQLSSVFIFPAEKNQWCWCANQCQVCVLCCMREKSRCWRSGRPSLVMIACWESWSVRTTVDLVWKAVICERCDVELLRQMAKVLDGWRAGIFFPRQLDVERRKMLMSAKKMPALPWIWNFWVLVIDVRNGRWWVHALIVPKPHVFVEKMNLMRKEKRKKKCCWWLR